MAAEDDIVFGVGVKAKLDDSDVIKKLSQLSKRSVPIRAKIETFVRGEHRREADRLFRISEEYQKLTGSTAIQATRFALQKTPASGSYARKIYDENIGRLKASERLCKEQEIELETSERDREKAQSDEEKARRREERQIKLSELIEKNTGSLFKLAKRDQEKIKQESRLIERDLAPGEEPETKVQRNIVRAAEELSKKPEPASSTASIVALTKKMLPIAAIGFATKKAYDEATREAWIADARASITRFRAGDNIYLENLGMDRGEALGFQFRAGMFNDQLMFGQISEQQMMGLGLFGRNVFAQLRRDPTDMVSLQAAFEKDVSAGEAQGFSRQFIAQMLGMTELLKTTGYSKEAKDEALRIANDATYQDTMSNFARETRQTLVAMENHLGNMASSLKAQANLDKVSPFEKVFGEERGARVNKAINGIFAGIRMGFMNFDNQNKIEKITPVSLGVESPFTPVTQNAYPNGETPPTVVNATVVLDEGAMQTAMNGQPRFNISTVGVQG